MCDIVVSVSIKITESESIINTSITKIIDNFPNTTIQKPFLKWVGGKTQIMKEIISKIPTEINSYHELFLGGGSVLLTVLSLQKQGKLVIKNKICAHDLNKGLINTFKQIKYNHLNLIANVLELKKAFATIPLNTNGQRGQPPNVNHSTYTQTREHYYYWIRSKYVDCDKSTVEAAGYFIFLNKTGFRGMYREGPNGFNVPYGLKDKKIVPGIINEDEIKKISQLIQTVEFKVSDFSDSIENVSEGDYIYLDPPYAPENSTSFVGYTKDGFGLDIHKKLFEKIIAFSDKKILFMMSNSKVKSVLEYFKAYNCYEVLARRAINSKNPGAKTMEVLVTNYN